MKVDNLVDGKRIVITHGELAIVPIDKLPKGKTSKAKMYIAGHSETGHHHILESSTEFKVLEKGDVRAVLIDDVASLFHKKSFDIHETRTLAPGAYQIFHKTEYDPFQKVVRQVWD